MEADVLLYELIGLGKAWEKGSVKVLRYECLHVARGLSCGEVFEEECQEGQGLDLVGFGGFHQGKEHALGIVPFIEALSSTLI